MSEQSTVEVGDKPKRDRSPSFPFVSLKMAVQRIEELAAEYDRHPALLPNAMKLWNYSEKSSGGQQTIAALKAFGLLEDTGSGKGRKIGLSDLARTILHDKRPGARENAVKKAAQKPTAIADHFGRWGEKRPPDPECLSELEFDRGFTKDGAKRFLSVYDETVEFAGLSGSDKVLPKNPPLSGKFDQGSAGGSGSDSVMTQDTFGLDEGQAVLQWPTNLSAESAEEFESWLRLIIGRAKRRAKKVQDKADSEA